ncbi:MAG TPA: dTDP-4-dehydrorhamnose 3,5-epimerase family protein [Aeromicrobium sp.]|nr:dTDP-4-dehydrorhamnose 3,5-epimerase family protein [Aeromicrobium sp.]HKY57464.1 dTDP-4-dehydrorhamnose 3,5-epimerase family protein [Aeromicrobium sp.]
MRCDWSDIAGVQLRPAAVFADDRGNFTKVLAEPVEAEQVCTSFNRLRGTVRGLHVQADPFPETKTLWCVAGAVWDVMVDLRASEPTYGNWAGVDLTASEPAALTLPPGVAHGYQVIEDGATIVYLISGEFAPTAARTLRWDDPTVGIEWPLPVGVMSEADRSGMSWPIDLRDPGAVSS